MLGERLRGLREEKKWSQRYLGELVNLSQQTIDHYEKGRAEPKAETLNLFSDLFGVTTDYLFGRDQYPEVNVSFELHEGANISSIKDVDYVLNEIRKELTKYINEGRISEEKAVQAVELLRQQLLLLIEQK
jgi:transcriptional regulator with XRE-family HTH domain